MTTTKDLVILQRESLLSDTQKASPRVTSSRLGKNTHFMLFLLSLNVC